METNYFTSLNKIKCEVDKKNWFNYISWADAWKELKNIHPDATYNKIKWEYGYLQKSWTWWCVEVEVTVNWITHTSDLAVTDFKNQSILFENIKSTDIQNTLQRAFTKAIWMHWVWLYVYRGEDLPEEIDWIKEFKKAKSLKELTIIYNQSKKTEELTKLASELKVNLK